MTPRRLAAVLAALALSAGLSHAHPPRSGQKAKPPAADTGEHAEAMEPMEEATESGIPDSLKEKLASPDSTVRAMALQRLKRGGTAAVPYVVKALSDPDENVRATAVGLCVALKGPDAFTDIKGLAADPSTHVLHEVLRAVRDWNTPPAIAVFLQILKDGNPAIRPYAIGLLEGVTDMQVVPAMVEIVRTDPAPNMRRGAFYVLRPLHSPEGVAAAREALTKEKQVIVREAALQTLAAAGCSDARPVMAPLLAVKDTSLRQLAANFLADSCQGEASEDFIAMLGWTGGPEKPDPATPPMTVSALQMFTRHPTPAALAVISAKLTDKNQQVRRFAVAALGALGGDKAAEALGRAGKDPDPLVRSAVMEAYGKVGGASAGPALLAGLSDTALQVRLMAMRSLGTLREPRAVQPLLAMLAEKDVVVRSAAVEALGALGDAKAVPAIVKVAAEPDPVMRESAANALGALGDAQAVEALNRLAADGDNAVRLAAVRSIGRIASPKSRPALEAALKDADGLVRSAARESLKTLPAAAKP